MRKIPRYDVECVAIARSGVPFRFSLLEQPTPAILTSVLQELGPALMVNEHHAAEYMIDALRFIDFLLPDSLQEIKVAGVLIATVQYATREVWTMEPLFATTRKKK